jgi:hypothetical protein
VAIKNRTGQKVQFRVDTSVVKKRIICRSVAVKRRLYVCCIYNETVIIAVLKSAVRVRLAKTEKA